MHFFRTLLIAPLLLGLAIIVAVTSPVLAATAELSSVKGIATTKDVEVSAKIIRDGQPIQGEKGSFSFKNPISGQSCTTPNQVSDAEGWIKGSCSSASSGQYEVVFIPESSSQQSLFVTFEPNNSPPPPSPKPSPFPSPEPEEEEDELEVALTVDTSPSKPSPSSQGEVTEKEQQSNPELRTKLLSRFTNSKNK